MSELFSTPIDAYLELERRFAKICKIHNISSILAWDARTYLPKGATEERSEQSAVLTEIAHTMLTDSKIRKLLDRAKKAKLTDWQSANLSEMEHHYILATCVPADLMAKVSKAQVKAQAVWDQAKQNDDFKLLCPYLSEVLDLNKEVAELRAAQLNCSPYDALLDGYERGLCTAIIDPLFNDLKGYLPSLLKQVLDKQSNQSPALPFSGTFAIEDQKKLTKHIIQQVGIDLNHSRYDKATHPFTIPIPDDARITTWYDENNVLLFLIATLHESGHALYGQGLPKDMPYQPVSDDRGIVTHESQSLIIEKQAGRTPEYIEHIANELQNSFGTQNGTLSADNLQKHLHKVEASLIRVMADEITYPLHIILRYDLERQMIDGKLDVTDLPGAWVAGMKQLLDITPKNDKEGCLQDIHWSSGAWGYFPTYLLGAIMAAQLFQAACAQDPEVKTQLKKGNFQPLKNWIRSNIHQKGSLYDTQTILRQATGKPLTTDSFKSHLRARYL